MKYNHLGEKEIDMMSTFIYLGSIVQWYFNSLLKILRSKLLGH